MQCIQHRKAQYNAVQCSMILECIVFNGCSVIMPLGYTYMPGGVLQLCPSRCSRTKPTAVHTFVSPGTACFTAAATLLPLCCHSAAAAAVHCTEGEAAHEAVPADVKTPRAGGNALGCVSSILSVLRLMYGTYTEAPSVPPAAAAAGAPAAAGIAAAAAGAGLGSGVGGAEASAAKVVQSVAGVDHVGDYRLAVQMWLPRDTHQSRCAAA